jgi:hypothetical protein
VSNLAVGNDGEQIVADSSTSTGLRYTAGTVQANPILNSAFQIAQRGTSIAATAAYAYNLDRWKSVRGGFALGATYSRQVTNDTTNLPFIQYCARVQRDSGNTSTAFIEIAQTLETLNSIPFAGKTVTVSFYARKGANYSSASSSVQNLIYTGTGTDQSQESFTGSVLVASPTFTLTTTWQRFSQTVNIGATATELAVDFRYDPVGTAGANDYFELTGVQIDIGSVALPFRTYAGTIQGELAACQRYYYRLTSTATFMPASTTGVMRTTTVGRLQVPLAVTMRVAPTTLDYSGLSLRKTSTDAVNGITTLTLDNKSTNYVTFDATIGSALTVGDVVVIQASSSEYWGVSAEL